ncbi:hypothetical protein KJ632_01840 [Patescibacteria group bacterium]|nr:hypothetical protein [Patescibacteria group bacterium]
MKKVFLPESFERGILKGELLSEDRIGEMISCDNSFLRNCATATDSSVFLDTKYAEKVIKLHADYPNFEITKNCEVVGSGEYGNLKFEGRKFEEIMRDVLEKIVVVFKDLGVEVVYGDPNLNDLESKKWRELKGDGVENMVVKFSKHLMCFADVDLPESEYLSSEKFVGSGVTIAPDYSKAKDLWAYYREGEGDFRVALGVLRDAMLGALKLHQYDYIHRDVKPGNILLVDNGNGKFKGVLADNEYVAPIFSGKETPPAIFGTAAYMPQFYYKNYGSAQTKGEDVFAFGISLWEVYLRSGGGTFNEFMKQTMIDRDGNCVESFRGDVDGNLRTLKKLVGFGWKKFFGISSLFLKEVDGEEFLILVSEMLVKDSESRPSLEDVIARLELLLG